MSRPNALAAITAISNAVASLGLVQGKIGTGQNKLQYAIQLAQSQITNFSAAESRIRDADVAQEAANLTKAQVLSAGFDGRSRPGELGSAGCSVAPPRLILQR